MRHTILLLATVAALALAAANRTHENQLQQGIELLETKGDLPAAVPLFEEVAKSPDRNLAARALLYLGSCYQKLGEDKAQSAYERIVRDFADQKDAAAEARTRLASLRRAGPSNTGIVTRQVWTGPKVDILGTVSPDGRYLSFVDWENGDLALRDLATGKDRQLVKGSMRTSNEFAEESVISPDGKQVAYSWFNKSQRYDLRLIGLSGNGAAAPRVLYDNEDAGVFPYDWSPDGKWIAVQIKRNDRTAQMGLVATADGSLRILKSTDWRGSSKLFFSPDSKYLAFDLPSSEDSDERDVFVLAMDGSREIPAVVHPANDVVMGWARDGRHLLFASDRTGSTSIWALPFRDGKPEGSPELVKPDVGQAIPMGITRSGSLYFGVKKDGPDVFVASVDFNSGEVLSPPVRPVRRFAGTNSLPDWSRDGKYLAYLSSRQGVLNSRQGALILAIRSVETGDTRELRLKLDYLNYLRWAPDGRSLAVSGTDLKGRQGIYRIDAQSGEASPIALRPPGEPFLWIWPEWAPDGKRIFYRRDQVLAERDLASGDERELPHGEKVRWPSMAPDGRYLAFWNRDTTAKEWWVSILPLEGGQPRELFRGYISQPGRGRHVPSWTPDSRFVLFPVDTGAWLVPVAGGQPRKIDLGLASVAALRVHPDGRQVAFTAGSNKLEVWVMENFLPTLSASK
ncbi:MAG: PD40 domain-containing protein [Acidobacteria bacterium]|nr:PD40 domain-containing protein [Acidobacteriota bacterium]